MKLMWNREMVTRYDYCCTAVHAIDDCFTERDKLKRGKVKSSTHIRCKWQNIDKISLGYCQAKKATTPFEAWNYLIVDQILGNTAPHTNQYILIHPNFGRAKLCQIRGQN
jgi:hypothetical protein